jgi:hypothetical protein
MKNEQNIKTTIYSSTHGYADENQVSVMVNRYAQGHWPVSLNGYTHEYEILLDSGKGFKVVGTMRATPSQAKKRADKYLIDEFLYLNWR